MLTGVSDPAALTGLVGPPPFADAGAVLLGAWKVATGPAKTKAEKAAQHAARKALEALTKKLAVKGGKKAWKKFIPGLGWGLVILDGVICTAKCSGEDWIHDCVKVK